MNTDVVLYRRIQTQAMASSGRGSSRLLPLGLVSQGAGTRVRRGIELGKVLRHVAVQWPRLMMTAGKVEHPDRPGSGVLGGVLYSRDGLLDPLIPGVTVSR